MSDPIPTLENTNYIPKEPATQDVRLIVVPGWFDPNNHALSFNTETGEAIIEDK